jgi:putative ATP-dependent endonuclease of the OLD family
MSIEGLFPDGWIIDCNRESPNWFESFSIDSMGNLEQFSIKDGHKNQYKLHMLEKLTSADINAFQRWITIFNTIENVL